MNDPMLKPVETHTVNLDNGRHTFVTLPGGTTPSSKEMEDQARAIQAELKKLVK